MAPKVWQIGAGDVARDYSSVFLDHDVMFLGPGDPGPWDEDAYAAAIDDEVLSGHKAGGIRQFATSMQSGDIVLLRTQYRVVAIGVVTSDPYHHNDNFDDVAGWDLQHSRRVIWQRDLDCSLVDLQNKDGDLFGDRKQIPTFTGVDDSTVLDPIRSLFDHVVERELLPLPTVPPPLELDEVGELLFQGGLANAAVDKVLAAIRRARRMAGWYYEHGDESDRPTEHEVVAYLVLPLLLALGWSEQLMAVEWRKADLVGFHDTPTTPDTAVLVCEAKHLGHGLGHVLDQAIGYVDKHTLHRVRRILTTDGMRFYLYRGSGTEWQLEPVNYLNLAKVRESHLFPKGTSGIETLQSLTPARIFSAT